MVDIAFIPSTLDQYYELRAAIFSGAQSVSYTHPGGAKTVTYRSLDDMWRILRILGVDLGLVVQNRGRSYSSFSKGLRPVGGSACDCCFSRDCRGCK